MNWFKKTSQKGAVENDAEMALGIVVLLFLLGMVYMRITEAIGNQNDRVSLFLKGISDFFEKINPFLEAFAVIISLLFIFGIVNVLIKYRKVLTEDYKKYNPQKQVLVEEKVVNEKWQRIQDHVNSDNISDWKLAILEADIILDEMLEKMGYHGDSVGEKLKGVEKSDFTSLDQAWEAHKIRNSIAHEGSDFLINEREAKRVISLYETVFKEFKYI